MDCILLNVFWLLAKELASVGTSEVSHFSWLICPFSCPVFGLQLSREWLSLHINLAYRLPFFISCHSFFLFRIIESEQVRCPCFDICALANSECLKDSDVYLVSMHGFLNRVGRCKRVFLLDVGSDVFRSYPLIWRKQQGSAQSCFRKYLLILKIRTADNITWDLLLKMDSWNLASRPVNAYHYPSCCF